MQCPYCDSKIKEVPDSGICPRCGGLLVEAIKDRPERKDLVFPDPPIGVYKDVGGYIEVEKESVTFYRHRWPFTKKSCRTIPFHEIYAVSYIAPTMLICGAVCVRQWQDRHVPLPTNDFALDETSVYFTPRKVKTFLPIYQFLKQCAEIVNAAEDETFRVGKAALLGRYKGFYGYMELGENAVTIYKENIFYAPTTRVIPYDEIAEVKIQKAQGTKRGGLSVRRRDDGKLLDKALKDAIIDESSIDFLERQNEKMLEVYAFLMDHVRENTKIWSQD